MSSFDVYCIICSNPCRKMNNEYEEEINHYIATKKKRLYDYEYMYEA